MGRRTKADTDWMSTTEAAQLVNEVFGIPGNAFVSAYTESRVRRAVQTGRWQAAGIHCEVMPGGYYISRSSLMRYLLDQLCAACQNAEVKAQTITPALQVVRRPREAQPAH